MSNKHVLTREGKWVTISDDELYHWKYIKREKVGGSWRYFYNNEEYQAYKNAQSNESKSAAETSAALKDARNKEALAIKQAKQANYDLTDDRAMNRGKTGDDIKQAQSMLKKLGYDLGTTGDNKDGLDGSFGPITKAAVEAYQKKNGLKVDGSIGPETMASLKKDAEAFKAADQKKVSDATKNKEEIIQKHKTATRGTTAAKKAYEKTAGAKVANFLTKNSDKIEKVDSWINKLLSKKKKK